MNKIIEVKSPHGTFFLNAELIQYVTDSKEGRSNRFLNQDVKCIIGIDGAVIESTQSIDEIMKLIEDSKPRSLSRDFNRHSKSKQIYY